jgi:hypothetical protein
MSEDHTHPAQQPVTKDTPCLWCRGPLPLLEGDRFGYIPIKLGCGHTIEPFCKKECAEAYGNNGGPPS